VVSNRSLYCFTQHSSKRFNLAAFPQKSSSLLTITRSIIILSYEQELKKQGKASQISRLLSSERNLSAAFERGSRINRR